MASYGVTSPVLAVSRAWKGTLVSKGSITSLLNIFDGPGKKQIRLSDIENPIVNEYLWKQYSNLRNTEAERFLS